MYILNNLIFLYSIFIENINQFLPNCLKYLYGINFQFSISPLTNLLTQKQLIWGNKFILFKNKSLMFDNWINSDLIYINDILNENGEISQNLTLDKLKYKNNWIY
jgi:hypothetical protein